MDKRVPNRGSLRIPTVLGAVILGAGLSSLRRHIDACAHRDTETQRHKDIHGHRYTDTDMDMDVDLYLEMDVQTQCHAIPHYFFIVLFFAPSLFEPVLSEPVLYTVPMRHRHGLLA